jgi:glycosyltransferase involved in cell wall biosynthesis
VSISGHNPAISVILSVCNGAKYLPEAVESILNQSFEDFEFILIDDGSVDGTTELLQSYSKRDSRIRLIIQENVGLTKSLNRGIKIARGEFIARMDGDDIAMPDRLEKQIERFYKEPSLVMLGSDVTLIDEIGRRYASRGHAEIHEEIRRRLLTGDGGALTHPSIMFRTAQARAIGGYDEKMPTCQDLDLYLKLSEVGIVGNLPDTLLMWRQHSFSVNHTKSDTWAEMRRYCIGKTIQRIGVPQFLDQLFPRETISLATNTIDKAQLAANAGFYKDACKLYWAALISQDNRKKAIYHLSEIILKLFHRAIFRIIGIFYK